MRKRVLHVVLAALFACLLCRQASAGELPLTAPLAGEYIAVDRPDGGVEELASYLYSRSVLTVAPYTEYSRTRLLLYATSFTSPVIARKAYVNYFEELEQVAPYVFEDRQGNVISFVVDEAGEPVEMDFSGERYEPMTTGRTVWLVNITLAFLHGLCFYAPLTLVCIGMSWLRARRRMWRSFAVTRLHTALCLTLTLAALNTFHLLTLAANGVAIEGVQRLLLRANLPLMALLAALPVAMVCCWKRGELETRQKAGYGANILVAAAMLAVMTGWRLYT